MRFEVTDELSLDELTEDICVENENKYIADSKKAVELIADLVHNEKGNNGNALQQSQP